MERRSPNTRGLQERSSKAPEREDAIFWARASVAKAMIQSSVSVRISGTRGLGGTSGPGTALRAAILRGL